MGKFVIMLKRKGEMLRMQIYHISKKITFQKHANFLSAAVIGANKD